MANIKRKERNLRQVVSVRQEGQIGLFIGPRVGGEKYYAEQVSPIVEGGRGQMVPESKKKTSFGGIQIQSTFSWWLVGNIENLEFLNYWMKTKP